MGGRQGGTERRGKERESEGARGAHYVKEVKDRKQKEMEKRKVARLLTIL